MEDLQNKIKEAQQVLRLAAKMSKTYYGLPVILCYSGGKDSDVMLDIAKKCLSPDAFEIWNSHTTVDAPETVYHIREVFQHCEAEGIKTRVIMPRYKGKPTSMWRLIVEKTMPPTRTVRYCCQVLKETSTPNRLACVGVREDESIKRRGRDAFAALVPRKERDWKTLQHTYAMFKLDQLGDPNAYECTIIRACKEHKDTLCNPIYKFTEADVWQYVREYGVPMNPLYSKGYKRVGCIGCPLGGPQGQKKEFSDYPTYKKNYIKAFDRMLERMRERDGQLRGDWKTGQDVYEWWVGENPKQIKITDILKN